MQHKNLLLSLPVFSLLFFSCNLSAHIKDFQTPVADYLKPIELSELNSGLECVDCIYVINLKERPEKWERTKKLFAEKNIKVNRLNAINGWTLLDDAANKLTGPYSVRLQACEYGRLLSYVSALKDAHEHGFQLIWICEDNIKFFGDCTQIPTLLTQLTHFDPQWDVFYPDVSCRYQLNEHNFHLTSTSYDPRPDELIHPREYYTKKFRVNDHIMHIRQRPRISSLLLSKQGIEKLLNYFTHVYLWSPFDVNIHTIPTIKEYSSRNDIASRWITPPTETDQGTENNDENNRKIFDLAQKLLKDNHLELALECYQNRVELGGDKEEVFWSLYQIGCVQHSLNMNPEIFISSFNKAYLHSPSRAEPLYRLAHHYHLSGENNLGYLLANYGLSLSPPNSPLSEAWIYEWGLLMEYSLCAYYSGRSNEFEHACNQMLSNTTLPDHVRKCVQDNLKVVKLLSPPLNRDATQSPSFSYEVKERIALYCPTLHSVLHDNFQIQIKSQRSIFM